MGSPLVLKGPVLCPQVSQKELKEALRRQWSQLSDKRRLKWISKALELQKDYEVPERTRPLRKGLLAWQGPGQPSLGQTGPGLLKTT